MENNEIWKPISIMENIFINDYEVSNLGRVRSWKDGWWGRLLTPNILKQSFSKKNPYPSVNLTFGVKGEKKAKAFRVHILVSYEFLGPPKNKNLQVNHINSNKIDNRANNLEYVSCKENIVHSYKQGTHGINKIKYRSRAKITEDNIKRILNLCASKTNLEISKIVGISPSQVSKIKNGKQWSDISGK